MMITINKNTGTYEWLQRKITDAAGNVTTEDYESEILEAVISISADDSNVAQRIKAARLRAALLTRDTDFTYSVTLSESIT